MKKIISLLFLVLCAFVKGQDVNWSQPQNTLLYQNPAFTALENKYSVNLNFRDQWSTISKAYRSYMASGDYRFDKKNNAWLGLGGFVFRDQQGLNTYKTTSAVVNVSCILRLNSRVRLGAGFGGGFVQNNLFMGNYTWGSQYVDEHFDPTLPSGEKNGSLSRSYSDFNTGIALSYDNEEEVFSGEAHKKWLVGYGINHITSPNISMTGGRDRLRPRHTGFIKGHLTLSEKYAVSPVVYAYYQGNMRHITFGSLVRMGISNASKILDEKKASSISFGLLYRYKDAFIPTFEAEKGDFVFALSYDVTVSKYRRANAFRGGVELSVRMRSFGVSDKVKATIHSGKKIKGTNTSTVKRKKKRFSLF
ncbi:MAG: PorP/SprF family type IX secretion system membrane protein [Bacteroidetes bacterium]|nr:PorP/SprF family type IX secretion system membrane protein [Bacteroidota bacterium]